MQRLYVYIAERGSANDTWRQVLLTACLLMLCSPTYMQQIVNKSKEFVRADRPAMGRMQMLKKFKWLLTFWIKQVWIEVG